MAKRNLTLWYAQNDPYMQEPMRALAGGFTLREIQEEYQKTYPDRYAEDYFWRDVQTAVLRGIHAR